MFIGYNSIDDPREETYIEGYVTDNETGEPLPTAWVEASYSRGSRGTSVGSDGYYRMYLDSDETYYVVAQDHGHENGYEEIILEHGEHRSLNFSLVPLDLTCRVYGYVLDSLTEDPVECFVYLRDVESNAYVKTNTDETGFYEIIAEPGFYTLHCYNQNSQYEPYGSDMFELSDGEQMEFNIHMNPVIQWVYGYVTDEYGDPLSDTYVYIDRIRQGNEGSWYQSNFTGEDGFFNMSAPAGQYVIRASCDNYRPYEDTIEIKDGEPLLYNIEMESVLPSLLYRLYKWIFEILGII